MKKIIILIFLLPFISFGQSDGTFNNLKVIGKEVIGGSTAAASSQLDVQ